ncbi:molybdenum cofactor guanylyltransferase [uncultured Anaeromusa sp.]|uniref:molybdenum cofactor guanylyltransferase n=1 Tax=uncultured Anaeromusa sp. TaxID=673273 RepID=UPI0029C7BB60|nr:molybdenum cofactor guanylyltransferase [uncultured Anaeromusa sp.]
MAVSGIVLAGGRSMRMGTDKTQLAWGRHTLLEQAVSLLRGVTDEVLVVGNLEGTYCLQGVRQVQDRYAGRGPLGGIHAGLLAAKYEAAIVLSCDMPFVTAKLAAFLVAKSDGFAAVTPRCRGRIEPLCAVYARSCLAVIEGLLQAGENQVRQVFCKVNTCYVEEEALQLFGDTNQLFFNLNTPQDWQEALRRKEEGHGC